VKIGSRALAPTTERELRRRYLVLTGLRWLPIGFLAPVLVLLPLSRGLSLPEVGVVFAAYGLTTALLELPTGGFADTLGRRLTLALSSTMHLAFFTLILFAGDVLAWVAAAVVGGLARALDSGPLQAWYVDEAQVLEPGVELRHGLSAAGAVEGLGLALSALAGGLLPALFDEGGLDVVLWAAIAVQALHLVLVLLMMSEQRRQRSQDGGGLSQVSAVIRDGIGQGARRGPVRLLLLSTVVWGIALSGIEILWQPRFITLAGGDPNSVATGGDQHTILLGVLMAGAFLLAAVGSMLTPWFARMLGGRASRGALVSTLFHGTALGLLAASSAVVPAAVAFLAFYWVNGLRGPLHNELLHEHVPSDRRSTMLSVESLTLQLGGFACTLALPTIAAALSIPWAWFGVAALLTSSAFLYRTVPDRGTDRLPQATGSLSV